EAWVKAKAALMMVVRKRDYNFIAILDKYMEDYQKDLSSNSDSDMNLNPKELMNPHKRKAKG
ncbi:3040_t:CDS:2, partial [Racocetra fulgida]